MYETLFIVAIICFVIAGGFLIATVAMFFGFNIPALRKEMSGSLEQKQIEEIRRNSSAAARQKGKVNVFEELEKKAKVKKVTTYGSNTGPTPGASFGSAGDAGTSVLSAGPKAINPHFIIEKNIMFVSTTEVM